MPVSELLLVVMLAGEKVALRVNDVESVTELEMLAPVPCSPLHVAGLAALRSRVLTVIDCQYALGLGQSPNRRAGASAAVVVHDGHAYALLLDRIDNVAEARTAPVPARTRLHGGWAEKSQGFVETDDGPLLVVNVAALIAGLQDVRTA